MPFSMYEAAGGTRKSERKEPVRINRRLKLCVSAKRRCNNEGREMEMSLALYFLSTAMCRLALEADSIKDQAAFFIKQLIQIAVFMRRPLAQFVECNVEDIVGNVPAFGILTAGEAVDLFARRRPCVPARHFSRLKRRAQRPKFGSQFLLTLQPWPLPICAVGCDALAPVVSQSAAG